MMHLDIRTFGAIGDGISLNTQAIQNAIDTAHAQGGGKVTIPQGRYLTGTIYLKSNVVLDIASGGVLLGSSQIADYATDTHKQMYRGEPHMNRCLIFAQNANNIGLVGHGAIDGQGERTNFPNRDDPQRNRPMMIRFLNCSNIRLRDLTLVNPASWTSAWLYCSDIVADGLRIHSRANGNGDGLDFDGCTNVRVSNCTFDTSDDSICLQTSRPDRPCRDIVICNCTFTSKWAGIRIGLLSRGDFENISVTNCVFRDIDDSGLKIQMCEGAEMKRMIFSNLVMVNVPRPIFLTFCQQRACVDAPEGVAPMKTLRDILFSNILVDAVDRGKDAAIILTGLPGHPAENITLCHITMRCQGGGTPEDARLKLAELDIATLGHNWPEYQCLGGTVPAYGLYARHLRGLTLDHVVFSTVLPDERPDIVLVDVD